MIHTANNGQRVVVVVRVPRAESADAIARTVQAAAVQREWAAETSIQDRVDMVARMLDALDADADRCVLLSVVVPAESVPAWTLAVLWCYVCRCYRVATGRSSATSGTFGFAHRQPRGSQGATERFD